MREKAVFAAFGGNETIGVFAIGTDSHMYYKLFSGLPHPGNSPWLPSQADWVSLGGSFAGAPCAGRHGVDLLANTGSFDVFGLNGDE